MANILGKLYDFATNPKTALVVVLLFFLGFFLGQGLSDGFEKNFYTFGPTTEKDGEPTVFMGIKLSSWGKVWSAYILIFVASFVNWYYMSVVNDNIHAYVWNPAVTEMDYSKAWTYIILILDPLIQTILYVILFFATSTLQLQYIIPQFLGNYIAVIPFTFKWLGMKKFLRK